MKAVLAVSAALLVSGTSWAGLTDGAAGNPRAGAPVDSTGSVWKAPPDARQVLSYHEAQGMQGQVTGQSSPGLQPPREDFPSFDARCRLVGVAGQWSSSDSCIY